MMKFLIVISNGNSISIIFRSKINLFSINPILQGRVVSKVINFCNPMGICWKKRKIFTYFPYFCISAPGISFSFIYMKDIVKSHQTLTFSKMFTSSFGPGIIQNQKQFFTQKNWHSAAHLSLSKIKINKITLIKSLNDSLNALSINCLKKPSSF